MENTRKVKLAMMAATSLLASSAAIVPAHAGEFDAAAHPAVIEVAAIVHAGDQIDQKAQPAAKKWILMAVVAGALAGLVKLLGAKKIYRAVKKTAVKTAEVSGQAAVYVARAAGRAIGSPLRFAVLMAGLAFFALTGVGFYDIEWIGGLIAGAAMTGLAAYGGLKARKVLQPQQVKTRPSEAR